MTMACKRISALCLFRQMMYQRIMLLVAGMVGAVQPEVTQGGELGRLHLPGEIFETSMQLPDRARRDLAVCRVVRPLVHAQRRWTSPEPVTPRPIVARISLCLSAGAWRPVRE
ncbi:hypothetical protein [Streptomyces sp. NPDC000229]|uniref:hypothetical protein n=1 Tax=Streptomyces sp. NPDC000229 TaxID=3154247 RepID=UPI00332E19D3